MKFNLNNLQNFIYFKYTNECKMTHITTFRVQKLKRVRSVTLYYNKNEIQ